MQYPELKSLSRGQIEAMEFRDFQHLHERLRTVCAAERWEQKALRRPLNLVINEMERRQREGTGQGI